MNELRVIFAGQTHSFAPGQTVRIGRSPDNAIVIPDPVVSRQHAEISWQAGGWLLDDLGKGRTFVGGLRVGSVQVSHPLDVHLASPLGPALRIEVTGQVTGSAAGQPAGPPAAAGQSADGGPPAGGQPAGGQPATETAAEDGKTGRPEPELQAQPALGPVGWGELTGPGEPASSAGLVRHASSVERSRLWRSSIPGGQHESAHHTALHHAAAKHGPGQHGPGQHGPGQHGQAQHGQAQHAAAQHSRPDAPGGDFATAVHILIPVRSWLKDPGWKQGARLLVIAYGLLPSIFVVVLSSTRNVSAPGWAYSLAIAPLWAVVFWLLIKPGHITKLIAWLAVAIVAAVMGLLPVLTIPWEKALNHTAGLHDPLLWIYSVGFAEEVTKALPVLVAALLLRSLGKTTLDVRVWMFLGTISGLAFGVRESVLYTTADLMTSSQAPGGDTIQLILTFALRVFVDGFQHAVWAGISAFFIGMGVNYRRRRIPLILFGITLPAVLHGFNDWSTFLISHWLWIAIQALSLLLFIGYTMSAASIERQVRDTPLFRGESMIMDRTVLADGEPGK